MVNPIALVFAFLEAQQRARIQEAEQARAAELKRVAENVNLMHEQMRQFRSSPQGRAAAALATPHEQVLLGQFNAKLHRAFDRGWAALRGGRAAEADKYLSEYDARLADALWIWRLLAARAQGADNRDVTDFWIMPGAVETRVEAVDATGKPLLLTRLMG